MTNDHEVQSELITEKRKLSNRIIDEIKLFMHNLGRTHLAEIIWDPKVEATGSRREDAKEADDTEEVTED